MNEITGIKQHFDLLIICLIIKKLQKLGTKIDTGDKDCFDPTGFRGPWCSQVRVVWTLFVLKASTGRRVAKGTPWETDKPPLIGPACC